MNNLEISISHESDSEFKSLMQQKIREFNSSVSPYHLEIRQEGAIKPINLSVIYQQNEIVAGVYAEMYWGWLDINYIWVSEGYRHHGIGSEILNKVEKIAKKHDCCKVRLTTYSFQAKEFYIKHGYEVVGQLQDYPPNHTYYMMTKELS